MRINFWAGAGAGKSTIASHTFSFLKQNKFSSVELVHEYIKDWVYDEKKPLNFDQVYIFGKQVHNEFRYLKSGCHIVSDSPILLNVFYAKKAGISFWQELLEIGKKFEFSYPSYNIFLNRGNIDYVDAGRYHTEEEARIIDREMLDFMECHLPDFAVYDSENPQEICNFVLEELQRDSAKKDSENE